MSFQTRVPNPDAADGRPPDIEHGHGSPVGSVLAPKYFVYIDDDSGDVWLKMSDHAADWTNATTAGSGPAGPSVLTWEPSSVTSEQFWSQVGIFAYSNAQSLIDVTALVYNGISNREGIDIENAPDLVSFSAPNLTSFPESSYGEFDSNPLLTTVDFSATTLFQYFQCFGNNVLATVNLGSAATLHSTFRVWFNPVLVNLNLSSVSIAYTDITASHNALSQASVNGILAMLVAATSDGSTPWNGSIVLSNQTPARPPSGQGITDVNTLVGRGASVTTD